MNWVGVNAIQAIRYFIFVYLYIQSLVALDDTSWH